MSTQIKFLESGREVAWFTGDYQGGTLWCRAELPLSVAAHLSGQCLGEVVSIDHPAGRWMTSAIIMDVETGSDGTKFQLTYKRKRSRVTAIPTERRLEILEKSR